MVRAVIYTASVLALVLAAQDAHARRHWRQHDHFRNPTDCAQTKQDVATLAADPKRLARVLRSLGPARCAAIARCLDQNEESLCRPESVR